jgi:hypothetical protein
MTLELKMLALSIVLGLVQIVLASHAASLQRGYVWTASSRDSNGPLQPLGGGMPKWIDGKADTECIATGDSMVAVIDRSGRLYVSHDDGAAWSYPFDRVPLPSGLHIC